MIVYVLMIGDIRHVTKIIKCVLHLFDHPNNKKTDQNECCRNQSCDLIGFAILNSWQSGHSGLVKQLLFLSCVTPDKH